ncbi:MAG: DNA-formamidopyrimidine glycosylase family protein, partial [Myxococcota bacterium]|nr:DNA-formamidopyrimidine glycosylase family protein [Myxococcota bacterium]
MRYHYLDGGVVPELPEVEIMAENARRWSQGRVLVDVEVRDHRIRAGQIDPRELNGAVFGQAYRRGKYLVLPLGERAMVFHFRMTGKLVPFEPGRRARLLLHLPERSLAFVDSRCLGQVWVLSVMDLEAFFVGRRLGPEPFPEQRDGAWWCAVMQGLTGPLKNSLMRQDRVAGLGNIAASEVCWRAQLHPEVPTHELS